MKNISSAYKNTIKEFGRELDSIITYELNGDTIELGNEQLNSISPHYEGGILKSVMKVLDIDSNEDIPIGTVINYQFGVKISNNTVEDYRDNYEYIDFGNYVVYKSEKQEDTSSYKITCYDKMLYSMKEYEDLSITYPITIRNYISAICSHLGLTFANSSDTFANYDKQLPNELYLSYDSDRQEWESLGYTFRDVLDELAEVTASTICINDDDELEIRYINNTGDTIDENYLKDINVNFGEQFGPINTIVLSRSAGADNIYYPSVLPENPKELKISDNQIMNGNDRDTYLPDIYDKLNGLQYYINDFSSTGITYYDLCDRYSVSIGENTYSCVMLNDDIQITTGLEENIYTDIPEESVTDYTKADTTDRRINQTQLIVDKQQGIIDSLVSNTTYVSDTKTGVGSIQLENAFEGQLYKLSISGNISLLFPQSSTEYGYPLVPSNSLTPSNTLTPSSPVPYGNEVHYPSSSLFTKSNALLIDGTEYKLDFDFLNYMSSTAYDEFVYDNGTCYIIRRVGIDSQGDMYALDNEVIEPRKGIVLNIKENSTISLKSFPNAILSATYLLQNTFTDNFATEVYVQSEIKQTADSITSTVSAEYETKDHANTQYSQIQQTTNSISQEVGQKVGDDEVVAKLNLAIQDGQGVVNFTSNQFTVDSDYFKVYADGSIEATNAELRNANIINGAINITQEAGALTLPITLNQTTSGGDTYQSTYGSGGLRFVKNNNLKLALVQKTSSGSFDTGFHLMNDSNSNSRTAYIYNYNNGGRIVLYNSTGSANIDLISDDGSIYCSGDLDVRGQKNRIVAVADNKYVRLSAYETAEPYFGDIGSNKTDNNGYCKIEIENIFSQTVENDDYKVFIQECGNGQLYVEKHNSYFEVKGTPNLDFDWEIKAIQKGYKNVRLKERESDK